MIQQQGKNDSVINAQEGGLVGHMKPGGMRTGLFILVFGLTGCPRLWLPRELVTLSIESCPRQEIDDIVDQASRFDRSTDEATLECALETLRRATSITTAKPAIIAAQICYLLADRSNDRTRAEKLGTEGYRWGEFALAHMGDREAEAHYYYAVNLGIAVRDEIVLALKHLSAIEGALLRAMDINPGIDDGGPVRTLGMLYLKAPAWPNGIGDADKALELLSRAAREWPDHPLNHIFYAQALWEVEGEEVLESVRSELIASISAIERRSWSQYYAKMWRDEVTTLASKAGIELTTPIQGDIKSTNNSQ